MAKQPRKQAKAKPITANPLFPAVVALWFGALFGLGSLAVRPSLLENLVIKSRIDLLVPAAAPPLGVTARALVALILAAIGAAIGVAIARRIARPKAEVRERKRSTLATREEGPFRHGYAAAEPGEPAAAEGRVFASRRRSLAIEHEEREFVPHDLAPLPGSAPQILDIASMGFAADPAESPEAPLDLGAYADHAEPTPVESSVFLPALVAAAPRQEFQQPSAVSLPGVSSAEVVAAAADGRQVFGLPTQPETIPAPRQIFGQAIENGHVSQDFVKAAGYKTTVFDTPEPSPLFGPRDEAPDAAEPEPAAFAGPAPFEVPDFIVPAAEVPEPDCLIAPDPADLPELPSPAALGMSDLAARLAESMARRRAARNRIISETPPATASLTTEHAAEADAPGLASIAPAIAAPVPQAFEPAPPLDPDPIPAAMRPLELRPFEDDAEPLADLLPPRRFAMPEVLAMPVAEPAPEAAAIEPEFEATESTGAEAAEDNYASLLGLAQTTPRSGFVRIEEPEAEATPIEPVVIFPGQMARPAAEEPAPFRRFDSPASAEHGQPVAASEAASSVDRDEADRALRMALANLQRMSGAA